jgi:propanol-preferring alcohol dehydrogenase
MKAMVFKGCDQPLQLEELAIPEPAGNEVSIRIKACGVCRTDLHIMQGDLIEPKPALVPGHEIVGIVDKIGLNVTLVKKGDRVGVPWLGKTCGRCEFCVRGQENLCDGALFTGYHLNGGFAEYCIAHELACYLLPQNYSDTEIAPLMCAGLIGYRSFQMAGDCHTIGFYGFGAAAHIICQIAKHQGVDVYAFTRPDDIESQNLAIEMGAVWAGSSFESLPKELDAAIIFAPDGALIPQALRQIRKGGKVVCAGIHMSPIPEFPYSLLWGERSICSVANLTRQDGVEFLKIAAEFPIKTHTNIFPLKDANEALALMASGKLTGAAVLSIAD